MNLSELTDVHIEALSATWALRLKRPNLYYKMILRQVKNGAKPFDELPYFIVLGMIELGYNQLLSTEWV